MANMVLYIKKNFFVFYVVFIVLCMIMHWTTIEYSPLPWIDEIQINEIARGGVFSKSSDWNMSIVRSDGSLDRQSWALYYLGGGASEFGKYLFGNLGNRVLNLILLLISTFAVTFYFLKKTKKTIQSYLTGLLYFTFPFLMTSVRGGRVDIVALTFLFLSLAILHVRIQEKKYLFLVLSGCSIFAALALFSWITVGLCFPIILWEVLEFFKERNFSLKKQVFLLSFMGIIFFSMILFLVSPFVFDYQTTIETFKHILALNSSVSSSGFFLKELLVLLCVIPGVYILGLGFLMMRMRFILLVGAVLVICLITAVTHCYIFRILYLLPYALIGIGLYEGGWGKFLKTCYVYVLFIMVLISFGYSVLLRNGLECFTKDIRDANIVREVMHRNIGGNQKIYCDTFELYYIGRELGWKQFRSASHDVSRIKNIISRNNIEYYITEKKSISNELSEFLKSQGFVFKEKIELFNIANFIKSPIREFLYVNGRFKGYGPYYLYQKINIMDLSQLQEKQYN